MRVQRTFPTDRYRSEEGWECSAEFAFRMTDLDFLYRAGFQSGRPKGCVLLRVYNHVLVCITRETTREH